MKICRETEEEREERKKTEELRGIFERTVGLREEFAKSVSTQSIKEGFEEMTNYVIKSFDGSLCEIEWRRMYGFEAEEEENLLDYAKRADLSPEKKIFLATYAAMENKHLHHLEWFGGLQRIHRKDTRLVNLYGFLKTVGYEMSDEEQALEDGTHELYREEEQ